MIYKGQQKALLIIDGWINLVLGILLLASPLGLIEWLGLPPASTGFYPSILGAVILGIGIALFIEVYGTARLLGGLGLSGAISINLIGSLVLIIWLIVDPFELPLRGYLVLWAVAVIVAGIGIVEIFKGGLKQSANETVRM